MTDFVAKLSHFAAHSSLIWKNPGVLPKVAQGYFKALVLRRPVLRTLEFAVTPRCNVNCAMCYATKIDDPGRKPMTPDDYSKVWQQAKRLGAFSAHLSGGEPTVRTDLAKIITALEPRHTLISMTTNAILLGPENLEKLRKAGLSVLHFSLNSLDPEINDRERDHKGHRAKVLASIAEAKKLGFEICLSVVVSHGNFETVKRLTEFAAGNAIGIVYSLATPAGNWTGAKEQLLTPEEWREVDAYMTAHPHVRSDWTINLSMRKGCPAGYEKVSISPYGDVQGCAMSFISHGNVLEEPLADIWTRMRSWSQYKKRSPVCLIGLDPEYIDEYIMPVNGLKVLPVPVEKHPRHPLVPGEGGRA